MGDAASNPYGKVKLTPPPRWHGAAEYVLRVAAFTAVAAIVLIFVFVAKEALPLFYDHEVRSEVTPSKMWFSQQWEHYDQPEHIWQPVSDVAKYAIWPLIVGTLKVVIVAMLFGVP